MGRHQTEDVHFAHPPLQLVAGARLELELDDGYGHKVGSVGCFLGLLVDIDPTHDEAIVVDGHLLLDHTVLDFFACSNSSMKQQQQHAAAAPVTTVTIATTTRRQACASHSKNRIRRGRVVSV